MAELDQLRRDARAIFDDALDAVDAKRAVLDAVEIERNRLRVCDVRFPLRVRATKIYSIAIGKAAAAMASALEERLGERLNGGVLSAPRMNLQLGTRWRVFAGGHPLPNESSLDAARAAFDLLKEADDPDSLVIFLVSGGGSAMMEWPRDERVTLEDLRETNRLLVSCGACIAEVNAIRRALSALKGGGLSECASRAAQVTLIISDVSAGRAFDVASGPTLPPPTDEPGVKEVVARYGLSSKFPPSVLRALEESDRWTPKAAPPDAARWRYVLLDNERACDAAFESARARGYVVEAARDISDQMVEEGASALAERLLKLRASAGGRGVCLISGGEFSCPVRGAGLGGRNAETALRCAFEFERIARVELEENSGDSSDRNRPRRMVALCAGTDGVDGNSPAAGAIADTTTLARAREKGLNARSFLDESDAYGFFDAVGDAIVNGATGTNVRDVRILLAS